MDFASDERRLGDYLLKERLAEGPLTLTWLAEQVSVHRPVLIDELRADRADRQEEFMADVRAKAGVDHPLIGSVFEAVAEPGCCFYAHERLPGSTFEQRRLAGEPFRPLELAHLLRRIAEANLHLETRGQSSNLLGLDAIVLDEQGVVRLRNLVIAGQRAAGESMRDVVRLGEALPALVADGFPGSTRVLTVLSWMRGEGVSEPIGWKAIRGYCEQIEQQLADPLPPAPTATTSHLSPTKNRRNVMLAGMALLGLSLIVVLAVKMRPPAAKIDPPGKKPAELLVAAGKYPTPDGTEEPLRAFRISAHEVTIGEYAEFLETLELLGKDGREGIFDHDAQPADKSGHLPDEWSGLFAAAKARGTWQGRPVTVDSPVIGVDWWDATAFAEWKQARLPTQEEWYAALRQGLEVPSALKCGNWQPVNLETQDKTPRGLLGMAGSVSEWTRRPAMNPNNPLGQRLWVIIGGSYLKPASGALSREWTDDRSMRRPDLGFRLVYDAGSDGP